MTPLKNSYPTTASLGYPNTMETHIRKNDLKPNLIKLIEGFKKEIKKYI